MSIFAFVPRLDDEKDPKILRQAISLMERHNETLTKRVVVLEQELAEAKGMTPEQLQRRLALLEQQLAQMKKKVFGASSERSAYETKGRAKSEEPKPRTGHGPTEQPELLTVPVDHDLDDADKTCPQCGGGLEEMAGQFEEHDEVDVIPARFVIKRHRRKKYRCRCGACIETALGPDKLVPGGRYSIGFAIHVAISKYSDHLPLERQVRMMGREGLSVTSQTLWDQLEALERVVGRVRPRLLAHIIGHAVVGADETRWRMLKASANKTWYVWLLHVSTGVYYTIENSRSMAVIDKLLGSFTGTLMCDAYASYVALAKKRQGAVVLSHCWAHVRRRFLEAEPFFRGPCEEILALIKELFVLDAACPTGPPGDDARRTIRDESSRRVVEDMVAWFWKTAPFVMPESALHTAIGYMIGAWKGLVQFLDDPTVPLDNNGSERAARGVVLGRKNHYGSKSLRGTEVAATFYSLVESAKLNELEPRFYLRVAVHAGLRGEEIPLPHEVATALADGSLARDAFDEGTEQLVATALAVANQATDPSSI